MDYMLKKYLAKVDFDSYEDFIANYKLSYPEDFNFGFDIVDGWAEVEPEKRALVWCDDRGEEKIFSGFAMDNSVQSKSECRRLA